MAWGVGGWLLTPFLQKIGRPEQVRLRERVVNALKTTFASHYTKVVSLPEALDLENIAVYGKRATGEKYLMPDTSRIQRGLQAEPDQQARGVGADLDAGADLADARRLLVDMDVEAGLQQMQRRGEAADAAADDRDLH